jgi:hypothetical protein
MSFYIKLGDTLRVCFGTSNASGAAADADSTPAVTVLEQGTAMAYSPTVANKATGLYEAELVLSSGNGFEVGKEYSSLVEATVGGVTGRDGLVSFKIAARAPDDLAYPATSGRSLAVAADGSTDANVTLWRGSQPAALSGNGLLQTMLMRILTDNAAGTPNALSNGALPANLERWRGTIPALLDGVNVQTSVQGIAAAGVAAIWAKVLDVNAPATAQTAEQILNICVAMLAAKLTNTGEDVVARDTGDTRDRVVGTADEDGNRTLTSLDGRGT